MPIYIRQITRELLWQEYRATHVDGYGYSQFCEHLRRQVAHRDLTLALDHEPGEVLMVDFAGKKAYSVDPQQRQTEVVWFIPHPDKPHHLSWTFAF